ncbi:stalk domain-containing protein [Anaerovorax odorimutans]|uniref:stalk domain-containing protein n=1 Tax=Anaerovorax odorimutans TaxID=109327 RepID=UPI0004285DE4|nr:stalk domain-containing protein [Anaerovorax odorimutans]
MKKSFKIFIVVALILSLTLSGTITALASDSNAIKVQYNGENIAFTDAYAKIVNGRVMVPLRQTLEAMGADITYDSKTKTISAKTNEKEISFAVGEKNITVIQNGNKSIKNMDVASFVDKTSNRTYVPVRFIAESMDYCVGWDKSEKTVVIIDCSNLFENVDKDFSIISKLFKTNLDLEKAYKTTGQFDYDFSIFENEETQFSPIEVSATGKVSGIQQKLNAELDMNLTLNMDKMISKLSEEEKTELQPFLDMANDLNMKIRMNGETGNTYMNSPVFSQLDPSIDENTWYKMNIYDMYDNMGIDIKSIIDMSYSNVNISEVFEKLLSMSNSDVNVNTYNDIKTAYSFAKDLIGDTAFKTTKSGSITTYTLDLSKTSILSSLAKTAIKEGVSTDSMDLDSLKDTLSNSNFNATITIKEKNGVLNDYSLKGNCTTDDIQFSLDMSGDHKNSDVKMTINQEDKFNINIKANSSITETTEVPNVEVPTDAKVVDFPM